MSVRTHERGMTAIELLISVMVMTVALGGLVSFLKSGTELSRTTTVKAELDRAAHRTLERMATELAAASQTSIFPSNVPFTTSLSFQAPTAWVNGAPVPGPPKTIEWVPDPTDPTDGVDNNTNGLVDEGRVLLRTNPGQPGERVEILGTRVPALLAGETANLADDNGNGLDDEGGLTFDFSQALTVHLTMQRVGPSGRVFTKTLEHPLTPRN